MNKFIQEGLAAGYEFIIIEPQEGFNEAIVAFDRGRLVYDTEKLGCHEKTQSLGV